LYWFQGVGGVAVANNSSTFQSPGLSVYFLSQRAKINGQPAQHLAQFIDAAKSSLLCAIYDLEHPAILKALKGAAQRLNTNLHIVYDAGKGKPPQPGVGVDPKPSKTGQLIQQSGLDRFATGIHLKGGDLMHDKFVVRDDADVWTGSGNFTKGGLTLQDNNFLAITSAALAKVYADAFHGLTHPNHAAAHAPNPPPAAAPGPHKAVKVGAITLTPYFTTGGNEFEDAETAIVKALGGAKKVRIAAMNLGDPAILGVLKKRFQAPGADIKGVLDPGQMRSVMPPPVGKSKQPADLFWFTKDKGRFVGAPSHAFVASDNNDFMHNKLMILDDKTVITGSYNFSEHAEVNDENVLFIQSPAVAKAYNQYFDALFSQYQKNGKPLPAV
jgi:phosphatidylserine/phosphatidylglycerophosphate/cardiolipin synthase-like enzyme